MKRIIKISAFILSAAALIGLIYFALFPKSARTDADQSQAQVAEKQTESHLISFRGVLADILKDVAEEAKELKDEIAEVIPNPFAEKKTETESAGSGNSFSFAVLGDTQRFTAGNSRGNFQKVVGQILKLNPDLVVAVGDLISGCEGKSSDVTDYANWKKILGALASKTYAVQGNHDRVSSADKCDRIWTDAFSFPTNGPEGFAEFAYSLDLKNSHFVFLDSNKPDAHQVNDTQRAWLEQDLARNKKENVFVFFHEPAYPVSDKAEESLDAEPSQRNALWAIFEKYDVTAVFNGHEHIVSRRKVDETYQFVFGNTDSFNHGLPAAGVTEYANQGQGRFGFVRVDGKQITVETHGSDGGILNTFTFSK
jgi:predicted phosphodiesterase